jgi:hypothetical protein
VEGILLQHPGDLTFRANPQDVPVTQLQVQHELGSHEHGQKGGPMVSQRFVTTAIDLVDPP